MLKSLPYLAACALLLSLSGLAGAQTFVVDKAHTQIVFSVTHLSLNEVEGRFNDFDGKVVWNEADPAKSQLNFTIQAKSVDTANTKLDDHLRSDDFFNVEKHPTITFKSTKIEKLNEERYNLTGDLTISGVTKSISFPATIRGPVDAKGQGKKSLGVQANFKVNRIDFKVGDTWQGGSDKVIGHDVFVRISGQAHQD